MTHLVKTSSIKTNQLHQMLRVDHAGEYGAKRIYAGQLAVLRRRGADPKTIAEIEDMEKGEQHHLDTFDKLLVERGVRPTLLHPVWHAAGFALGAATALLGEKAAMACTVAVEETIGEHYNDQLEELEQHPEEAELAATIKQFRDEELEHHDTGIDYGGKEIPGYEIMRGAIRGGSKLAIWLSSRV